GPPVAVADRQVIVGEPADAAARAAIGGDDHAVHRLRRLQLEPALATPARLVGRAQVLGHHALVAGGQRTGEDRMGLGHRRDHGALGQIAAAGHASEGPPSTLRGLVDEGLALGDQAIEEVQGQRNLAEERLDVVDAAEATHQLLEGQRSASRIEGDDLAVEDERRAAEAAAADLGDIGTARGAVGQAAGPDPDALAASAIASSTRPSDPPVPIAPPMMRPITSRSASEARAARAVSRWSLSRRAPAPPASATPTNAASTSAMVRGGPVAGPTSLAGAGKPRTFSTRGSDTGNGRPVINATALATSSAGRVRRNSATSRRLPSRLAVLTSSTQSVVKSAKAVIGHPLCANPRES